ncbi:hypothetical protein C8R46DRAFT_901598 [Mycena filopes]|nr:hypothetical protein C8R46DRAFT_901598 [Mycena filopes]
MPTPDLSAAMKQCAHCHTTSTPLWRRDPSAPHRILCNACGLFKQQRHAERPKVLIDADDDGAAEGASPPPGSPECSHCHATTTSVWRRNKDGERVCNACGCWQRLHNGEERPLSMKRNKVKPRARPPQM